MVIEPLGKRSEAVANLPETALTSAVGLEDLHLRLLDPQTRAARAPRFAAVPLCRSGGTGNRGGRRRTIPNKEQWWSR